MKRFQSVSFTAFALLIILFSGCSSKKYFEPEQTYSASSVTTSFGSNMVELSRDGGTLETGNYVGKAGVSTLTLGEGYRFLNENSVYVLATNIEGTLKVISKKTKKTVREIPLQIPVVAASVKNDMVVYILDNNTFGIYSMSNNRKVVESRSERTYAIDTRAANPIFIDNLAVMPMLDGKLIIVNAYDTANAKVVYISSEKVFNNVIYLERMGNTMVAATPKRLITLGTAGKLEYTANISEVAIDKGRLYLFTKEGEIIALNSKLNVVASTKFKFAHYSVATAFSGRVYALDQQGSLIVLNSNLTKYKIYDLGEVGEPAFIMGTNLYKDGKTIELSKLGYE